MAWIEEAPDEYQGLPEIFRVMSLNPDALEQVKQLNETLAFGNSGLSRAQEEAIATVAAAANRCRYNSLTHGGFLRRHSGDAALASGLLYDYTQVELDPADRKMLDFVFQLTRSPESVTREDVEGLREAGFEDQQVLAVVLLTCLCGFMDRLAQGLGVQPPAEYRAAVARWLTGPARDADWLMGQEG